MKSQMNLIGPSKFKIKYNPTDLISIECDRGTAKFSGEMTSSKPKLYIFSRDGQPVYVGATVQSMRSRLRYGWKATGKNGFWGYSFRHDGSDIDLHVWHDSDPVNARAEGKRSGSDIETIEAEVVYLIRHHTSQWPSHQTEIHFYQAGDEHRREARRVAAFYGIGN